LIFMKYTAAKIKTGALLEECIRRVGFPAGLTNGAIGASFGSTVWLEYLLWV